MSANPKASNTALKNLPSVDDLLRSPTGVKAAESVGRRYAGDLIRTAIEILRVEVSDPTASEATKQDLYSRAEALLGEKLYADERSGTRRVINATGVIIHTNLGRAPLSELARKAVIEEAAGYCTLEYDAAAGKRGKRGGRVEAMLAELTGAEAALVVNNCAAAAFFVLNAIAAGGEVVISRGELVEIGGDFRVPDVLESSGAKLREVGTTNRTKLSDYKNAINEATRLILRVHPSNYRIVGFTAMPTLAELSGLARESDTLLYEDLGSGALIDMSPFGLNSEPTVADSIKAGVDIVTFSGDKLLGGPQSGIIAGRREHIERLRKNPLYRALRVDKLILTALEATLTSYRRERAVEEIPVLRMLAATKDEIRQRAVRLTAKLTEAEFEIPDLKFEIVDGVSAVGGGAAPDFQPETVLIAVKHTTRSAARLEHMLRNSATPVIGRIENDRLLIDLRTVFPEQEKALTEAIKALN